MTAHDDEQPERDGFEHDPVMLREIVEALGQIPAGVVVDATLGAGGHSEALSTPATTWRCSDSTATPTPSPPPPSAWSASGHAS